MVELVLFMRRLKESGGTRSNELSSREVTCVGEAKQTTLKWMSRAQIRYLSEFPHKGRVVEDLWHLLRIA